MSYSLEMDPSRPLGRRAPAVALGRRTEVCPVLIGRDDLVSLAVRRLRSAAEGAGQLLFLAGEAGIGKTRLLLEIAGRADALGFAVVGAQAFPQDAEVAGGVLANLASAMRRCPDTERAGRELTDRLREDSGVRGDSSRRRRMLVTDLSDALVSVESSARPLLIAFEDLHWADSSTLEVLERAALRFGTMPVMVVGTYRTDELGPGPLLRNWRTRLLNQRLAEEARLPRLGPADTAAMTSAIADRVIPGAVSDAIFARSDGIPLHVEEFLATVGPGPVSATSRSAISAGSPPRREGTIEPADGLLVLPDTLADAVLTRAASLGTRARGLAGAAAVIGRSFDIDLLTAVSGHPPAVVDEDLRELTDGFFIQPDPGRLSYDFRHSLIRDALYADLSPHERREMHARVAAAASRQGAGDAFLSGQFECAQQAAPAHRHAVSAARAAAAVSAHREAVQLYLRAQRTMPAEAAPAVRAELLAGFAAELAATDDNEAADRAYTESAALYRGAGDDVSAAALVPAHVAVRHLLGADLDERTALLRASLQLIGPLSTDPADHARLLARNRISAALTAAYMLDRRLEEAMKVGRPPLDGPTDPQTRANLDATLGSVLLFAGRMSEGWNLLERAVRTAVDAHWEAEAARAYRMIGTSASVLVEYDRAEKWLTEGVDYAERTERFNDRHYMAAHVAHVRWAVGDWVASDRRAQHALADGRGGITTRITALLVLGYLALGRGNWAEATERLTEATDLATPMRELQRISPAYWGLAETALWSGRPREAMRWCEQGFAASAAVQDAAYLFPFVVTGTRAQLAVDDLTGARDWMERSTSLVAARSIPGAEGAGLHADGLIRLHEGQTGKARVALEAAEAFWAGRRRFWEGNQALLDLARCALRSRRPAEGAALAEKARVRAAEAGAVTLVGVATDLLAKGVGPSADRLLTARESEVAALVATGATNREIAAALVIAPKTVAAHIEHILTKLGAARRTQIATWVASRAPADGQPDLRSP